jgi:hypothetical protein
MKSWDLDVEVDNPDHLEISHDWDAWVGIDNSSGPHVAAAMHR